MMRAVVTARRSSLVRLLGAVALAGCSTAPPSPTPPPPASIARPARITPSASPAPVVTASAAEASASPVPEAGADRDPEAVSAQEAEALLYPLELSPRGDRPPCQTEGEGEGEERKRIRCLIQARYGGAGDEEAGRAAIDLYDAAGVVAGLLPTEEMDGGFRGKLLLVPELPVAGYRKHLGWVLAAHQDFERFFTELRALAPGVVRYRSRGLGYRFFRSHKRTTPSAYALGWSVAYNVVGSLNTSASAVRETLFHEIFHLDDAAHGDWSARVLGKDYDGIVARCGTKAACLRAYTPMDTMVRGGTYYAFQPGNGESVHEYGAELATRYYLEQRAMLRGEALGRPAFKCGPPENRAAWAALSKEFFGGFDRVPACAR